VVALPRELEGPAPRRGLDAALVAAVVAGLAALTWSPGYRPDPDSYYHVGCARLYAAHGWLSGFPWLPYTVLGPSFPNVHLLQHLALAPLAGALRPEVALRTAPVAMSAALALSVLLVLRRWRVPHAGLFTALGLLSAPLLILYSTSVKGGALFFVLLVWFVEAVWARSRRRVFVLAWLSVYAYVGAPVLLLVAAAHAAVDAVRRQAAWWHLPAATALGLAAGLVLNPFWPGHLPHIARELLSAFSAPATLVPGVFRGGEWLPLDAYALVWFAGAPAAAWAALAVRQAARGQRWPAPAAAGLLLVLALFSLALVSGTKFLYLFALTSVLFLPLAAMHGGPWRRGVVAAAAALAVANAGWSFARTEPLATRTRGPLPAHYAALGSFLATRTAGGEVVVAPWDDFPGLFLFEPGRRYVAGVNLEFLLRADPARFDTYLRLYRGVHPDPAQALASFDGARVIVARRPDLDPAGGALHEQLARLPAFEGSSAPGWPWAVFRRR
jgi:hypothetical protein